MSNTHTTICESSFGVIGYGRIGSILALILKKLGADVTVFARNELALEDAKVNGCCVFRILEQSDENYFDKFANMLNECSVIFNTVPSQIINEDILTRLSLNQTYIELASSPGGIDSECARKLKLKNIYAPSLPGRYAPRSAGKYIFDEIFKALSELEISESEGL